MAMVALATAVVILAVVWNNLSKTVHKNLFSGLSATELAYRRELNNFQSNKIEKIDLMLVNNANMQALRSSDKATQQKALQNIKQEVEADFVAVKIDTSPAVTVISLPNILLPDDVLQEMLAATERRTSYAFFYNLDGVLYWLLTAPGPSIDNKKSILMGFKFDARIIKQLSETLGMRIAIVYDQQNPKVVSSLETEVTPEQLKNWQISDNYLKLFKPNVVLGLQTLYTKRIPIEGMKNDEAFAYLTINAQRISTNFIDLLTTIALVSLLAVFIAIALGIYFVRIITRPLAQIVQYTDSIAQGNYSDKLVLGKVSPEFTALTRAFELMLKAVREREATITKQVEVDPLTKLLNRGYLKRVIDQRLQSQDSFQAIGINIRGFRSINDVFGYEAGDACLTHIAERVKQFGGVAARVTGGEIIWLPGEQHDQASLLELQSRLEKDVVLKGIAIKLKIIIGVLHLPQDATGAEDLYRRMNIVIDEAHASKTFLLYYSEHQEQRYLRRLSIISELKETLDSDSGQLSLVYQPKIALGTQKHECANDLFHLEALARWEHPALGRVSPDEFVSVAEHAGFINLLTRWVIKTVIADLISFRESGIKVNMAINICADDVLDVSLLPYLQDSLAQAGLGSDSVLLELTERVILKNPKRSIERLLTIKEAGFKIAIDDFGTGYSSLSYLSKLPIDILKIDKSFVLNLAEHNELQAICKTILTLAQNLNMEVVAEGIEDQASMQILTDFGCKWGQGYHICKPLAKTDVITWINNCGR